MTAIRNSSSRSKEAGTRTVRLRAGAALLEADLTLPDRAKGIVLFAHGQGSDRHSPRNVQVAGSLHDAGFGTLLMDLATLEETLGDVPLGLDRFARRLVAAAEWLGKEPPTSTLAIGLFGGSTGAAVALRAAAELGPRVRAVVSRGGRTDLAEEVLGNVRAPTLFLVGENDAPLVAMNRRAVAWPGSAERELALIPGASHLFEEPGALEDVALRTVEWFARHLAGSS